MATYDIVSDELLFSLNENNLGNKFLKLQSMRGLKEPMSSDVKTAFNKYQLHSYINNKTTKIKKIDLNCLSYEDPEAIYIAITHSTEIRLTEANGLLETVKNIIYKDLFKKIKTCNKDKVKAIRTLDGLYPTPELDANEYEVLVIVLY